MLRRLTLALGVVLALTARGAAAQSPSSSGPDAVAPAGSLEAVASMKSLLHNVVMLQEKYWYEHGKYASDVTALRLSPGRPGDPVAQVLIAGTYGWAARAQHPSLSGKSCVVYVGNADHELGDDGPATSAQKVRATAEGTPACDEPEQITKATRP